MTLNNPAFLHERFALQVENHPHEIAIRFDNREVTYNDLNKKVNRLVRLLIRHNARAGDVAAVDIESPLELAVGILGIMKAGGIYMPLDFDLPRDYIHNQLEQGKPKFILTHTGREIEPGFKSDIIYLDRDTGEEHGDAPVTPPAPHAREMDDPLALVYLGHSSGKPRGIVLSHRNVSNWISFNTERLNVDFTGTLFIASPAMKAAFPLWLANLVTRPGGTVGSIYYYYPEKKQDTAELIKVMTGTKFTSVVCPLHFIQNLVENNEYRDVFPERIRGIVSMGEETFDAREFKRVIKERKIKWYNFFGFPEMSMVTTLIENPLPHGGEYIHAGKPGTSVLAHILNRARRPVAIGLEGELYVSGSGTVDFYYQEKAPDNVHFFKDPTDPAASIYKTGWRARWLPDGKIAFPGRTDDLVNIHGRRIALKEVEAALFGHPAVYDCAVVKRENTLTAFLVFTEGDGSIEPVEEHLREHLPPGVSPMGFVILSRMPRRSDGRIDRKYLETCELLDTLQLKAVEKKIEREPGIRRAAVLMSQKTGKPAPLHLKDHLPGIKSTPGKEDDAAGKSPAAEQKREKTPGTAKPLAVAQGDQLEPQANEPRTLALALKRAAEEQGDNGIIYIRPDGSEDFQTYPALLEEAERVSAGLRYLGLKPGDKVIFQFDRNNDFVSAFWGCQLGGFVPVPMTVPRSFAKPGNETATLHGVWQTLDKPLVLTGRNLESSIRGFFKEFWVETVEDLQENEPHRTWHNSDPEDLALLLFTSGSTGKPKGVMQCHRGILSREKGTCIANAFSPRDISVNWMPLEHVGGVVMFHLRDVWLGCMQIHARTEYILSNPLKWLDIVTRHKATVTWAPNFAYALLNDLLENTLNAPWDLSSMRFILNGGEAVNAKSSKTFLTLLAPYGLPSTAMKPAWGMSETCSGVMYSHTFTAEPETGVYSLDKRSLTGLVRKSTSQSDSVNFTGLGKPIPGFSIRIADPRNRPVEEGMVGRIQVKGPSVTRGYYNNPELNDDVFTSDGWFDTGDLGFILDGCMTITGRAKDVIIVNGINFNSVEIEAAVEEVEGVLTSFTAACAVRGDSADTDRIVIFYSSLYPGFDRQLEQIKEIHRTFVEKFAMNLDYAVPIARGAVPKTSIGKIQRTKLGKMFEAGTFDPMVKKIDIALENENTLPAWFYVKSWTRKEPPFNEYHHPGDVRSQHRICLVFEDGPALGDALVSRLEARRCQCIRVKPGIKFNRTAPLLYEMNYREPGHYDRLIGELSRENTVVRDIFHLYNFGPPPAVDAGMEIIKESQDRGVYSLLRLIRALNKEKTFHHPLRLFVISSSAQFTSEDDSTAYEKCTIPGFIKSAALELPGVRFRHIDLEPDSVSLAADNIIREWKNPVEDKEVAYREDKRLVPCLSKPQMDEKTQPYPLKQGGIYLVTGGLGGIGKHVCLWLMKQWGARLAIVGRTPLPPEEEWADVLQENTENTPLTKRIKAYRELQSMGRDFIYIAGDVGDPSFPGTAITRINHRWGEPPAGVFHLAGFENLEYHWTVMDRHWAAVETTETFETMFQTKVYGTVALHRLLVEHNPEAVFVAFSSTTGFFGAGTFSAYAAANSFLDAFCFHRRFNGFPNTYCLDWSSWDNVGMSENTPEHMVKAMRSRGYETITPGRGVNSLAFALGTRYWQLMIGLDSRKDNISRYLNEYPSGKQVLNVFYTTAGEASETHFSEPGFQSRIPGIIAPPGKRQQAEPRLYRIDDMPFDKGEIDYKKLEEIEKNLQYAAVEGDLPRTGTEKVLAGIWKEVLGKEQIGVNDNFFELGGHSLRATILASRVHKELNVDIPLAEIFNRQTIRELSRYIADKTESKHLSIEAVEKKEYYELSSAQKRLYFLQQLDSDSLSYNIPSVLSLGKGIDITRLHAVLKQLIARHESLRTSFIKVDSVPFQRVYEPDSIDFSPDYYEADESAAPGIIKNYIRPFDLSRAPLLRSGLIKHPGGHFTWLADVHHIVSDGTSHTVLIEDFNALYTGKQLEPSGLRIQYKDFSQWQNRLFESEKIKKQEAYWLELYSDPGEIPRLQLPVDFKRPDIFTFKGDIYDFVLEGADAADFKSLGADRGSTLYMNFLAALSTLFYKYSGQTDIIIGSGIAGRRHAEIQRTIGMFVNTLAMRNHPGDEKTYGAFLREVVARSVEAFENQDLQFEEFVDRLDPERDPSRNPLFDILMVDQNFGKTGKTLMPLPTLDNSPSMVPAYKNITAKFDLTFFVFEQEGDIHINIEYYTGIFRQDTVKRLAVHFKNLVKAVTRDPGIKLKDIDILSREEKEQVLHQFNNTTAAYPGDKTIHELFREQAAATPDAVAVVFEREWLTYRCLEDNANRLADYLYVKNSLQPGEPVGTLMDRSAGRIVAILGILEAGGGYVPVNPSFPEERIKSLIDDARIGVVISESRYIKTLNRLQWECPSFHTFLCMDGTNVYLAEEVEKSELMGRKLWEYVGETAEDEVTGGGWLSSYTGEPIPKIEMDEYGDNILKKLSPLLHPHMRILEIGCASGISMYRIAPGVGFYYGTDLSGVIIKKNKERIVEEGHRNIVLACLPAHEIDTVEEREFDLVIVNSVIQCFHGHNYLRKVIRKAVDLLGEKGHLFIGDVMDQDSKRALIHELTDFKRTHREKNYTTKTDWSTELFVSRQFFEDLTLEIPGVQDVAFSEKIYTIENELTKFRYDALITVNKTQTGKTADPDRPKKHKHQHDLRILDQFNTHGPVSRPGPRGLAYVMYTSGSTGKQKGVMVEHRNVVRLVKNTGFVRFNPGDRILQTGALEFDASTFEIWGALLNGLSLYLVGKETLLTPAKLKDSIRKYEIATIWMSAPLFNQMLETDIGIFKGLRCLLVGGDVLSPVHINRLRREYPDLDVINGYGPTENTTFSTTFPITREFTENIPIGKPVTNSTAYILDGQRRPQPVGVPGELYVGGDGVSRGYLNNPELTAETFCLRRPGGSFEKLPPGPPQNVLLFTPLYRTGDLARRLPDGNIEFLGRYDFQVKIRGYRIELGEIENLLLKHEDIKEAVVIVKGDPVKEQRYLAAYFAAAQTLESPDLREFLSVELPEFMIPSYFVQLDGLPLTQNGKLDRKALPEPEARVDVEGYIPPRDDLEKKLVGIWSEVLGMEKSSISVDADFFQLGGHSLKATVLVSKLHKELDVKVPLAEIFRTPTVLELAQYIKNAAKDRYAAIGPTEKKEYYPLSSAQERLYVIRRMDEGNTGYNSSAILLLEGSLDKTLLEETFRRLIARHESLRTSFEVVEDVPVQRIHRDVEFVIDYYPVETEAEVEVKVEVIKRFIRPFHLAEAPLLRVGLVQIEEEKHILMVDMHHIVTDGTSYGVLTKEFMGLYAGGELPPLRIQYKDFSLWQNDLFESGKIKEQEAYWLDLFQGEVPVLNLPTDYRRPPVQGFEGKTLQFEIGEADTAALRSFASTREVTLYMLLLSVYNVLLSKLGGREDIVVGTPIAGRRHADLQNIIGMFVNTLAMRNFPNGGKSFTRFLDDVKQKTLAAYENQEYQFEDLVERVVLNRDAARNPLFDTLFALQNIEIKALDIPGLTLKPYEHETGTTVFDITLQVYESGRKLLLSTTYSTRLFKAETIHRFIDYFKRIIHTVLEAPGTRISEIEIIPEEERKRILYDFNDTASEYPRDKTIHQLFEEQSRQTPDAVALHMSHTTHMTYLELNRKAGQPARLLREKGVRSDTVVAIKMERSLDMIIGIMGILKAGAAYLPIDPTYPGERIDYMLKDSNAQIHIDSCRDAIYRVRDQYSRGAAPSSRGAAPSIRGAAPPMTRPTDLAYIIYTSGTTGRPRGVAVTHRNVVRVVKDTNYIEFTGRDRVLQLSNYAFDGSVFDIYGALLNGSQLVMLKQENVIAVEGLAGLIKREGITVFFVTTALFNTLIDIRIDCFERVRKVLFGGERVSPDHTRRAFAYMGKDRIVHVYGPTESTVYATYYPVNSVDENESTIPIGLPIANTSAYILDKYSNLVPIGVTGELYLGGDGLARGYLNRPELTAEKFEIKANVFGSPEPFFQKGFWPPEALYRTGDMVKRRPDGRIEFLGRIDGQVKLRGFRIELGEIESRLSSHERIREAVVIVTGGTRDDRPDQRLLAAYFTSANAIGGDELREYLSLELPEFMIPSYFVQLETLPLTPNGKIDRGALPEPEYRGEAGSYTAPRDDVELKLVGIWSEILGIDGAGISIDADFFRLGGHSLKAAVLLSRMHKALDVKVPLAEIFRTPTVQALAKYVKGAAGDRHAPIGPVEKREYYRLSPAQKRLYILRQMEENNTAYNISTMFVLEGALDRGRLEKTFNRLVSRHESFRTSFEMREKEPVQRIHGNVELTIEDYPPDADIFSVISQFIRPFDLSRAPLLRIGLIKVKKEKHILAVDMHHIISDGTSLGILAEEFMRLYAGEKSPPPAIQYKDFSHRQNDLFQSGILEKQESYWLDQFDGEIVPLNLPTDYPRPPVRSFEGSAYTFDIGAEQTAALKSLASGEDVTLYMLLLSIYNVLAAKLGACEDIIVGAPTAGRGHADLQNIIGMFVNTLAIRSKPRGEKPFSEFLGEVKESTLTAFENQDFQFEDLVEKLGTGINRDTGRNPLFDIVFVLQNMDIAELEIPGLTLKPYILETTTSIFDLALQGFEAGEKLLLTFEFSTQLFKKETIRRFENYLRNIIEAVCAGPGTPISRIDILTPEERRRVLVDFNDTHTDYPRDKTIHQLFDELARQTPDVIALIMSNKTHNAYLTYSELNRNADQMAYSLQEKGVKPGAVVGIKMERSLDLIIGIMGILKAGAAYLPIKPDYPQERIDYMLKDSNAKIVINDSCRDAIYRVRDQFGRDEFGRDKSRPYRNRSLAYVIYTSGSTGRPKGVMIEHRGVVRLVKNSNYIHLSEGERLLLTGSIVFDITTFEIWGSLLNRVRLYLADHDTLMDPEKLGKVIARNVISVLHLVPQLFNQIAAGHLEIFEGLRYFLVGGDLVQPKHVNRLRKTYSHLKILHMYGPTENTTFSTFHPVDKTYDTVIPIGKPIADSTAYILDKNGNPQPIGVPGELYVGGDGTARGYLNNPELTAEKFCLRRPGGSFEKLPPGPPQNVLLSTPLYRSGDLARWLPDGNLEFLGRIDHQVKIRGIRIEPGEIEGQLMRIPYIKDAVVIDREDAGGEKNLYAYIVPEVPKTEDPDLSELRYILSGVLPEYMIPSYFVTMKEIPLTSNGKVDRKALPRPRFDVGDNYRAPRDEIEEKLAGMWSEILGIDKEVIGIDGNFFLLGGHSLKATVLVSGIHKTFNVKVPLAEMFKAPTIEGLSRCIKAAAEERYVSISPVEEREYYALSSAQKRLFILQKLEPGSARYNMPAAVVLEGTIDVDRLEKTCRALIERHESLRTYFFMKDNQPVQGIHRGVEFKIEYYRSSTRGTPDRFIRAFDLSRAPLLRMILIREEEERHILFIDMHHIVTDGTSMDTFFKEFMTLYGRGEPEPLTTRYRDYAQWQNREKESVFIKEQGRYWLERFADEIPILDLPLDYPRPSVEDAAGSTVTVETGRKETGSLKALALKEETTLYMVLLSVFNVLLAKLGGREDIIVGTPIAGRRHTELRQVIGMFVNTLALRNFPTGDKTFIAFLEEVKNVTLAAYENQEYPFEDLVEKTGVTRNVGRNPLFDVMFTLQNVEKTTVEIPGLTLKPYEYETDTAKFDLTLQAYEAGQTLRFALEFRTRLFKPETIRCFAHRMIRIIEAVCVNPGIRLSDIDILTADERHQLLYQFNETETSYPRDKTIHQLFEEQTQRTPDAIALNMSYKSHTTHLSYNGLNRKAGQLAYLLREKGVGPDDIVAIKMDRSPEMIIAIMGILKAGGAYLPIDPTYPDERIDYMLKDSNAKIHISSCRDAIYRVRDQFGRDQFGRDKSRPYRNRSLAYIIYTSGTTGRPKGILTTHANAVRVVKETNYIELTPGDRVLQLSNYAFDGSVFDIYGALLNGSALVMVSKENVLAVDMLADLILREAVTVFFVTTALFNAMVDTRIDCLAGIRKILFGGEKVSVEFSKKALEYMGPNRIIHVYGPTETTVYATYYPINSVDENEITIPIGLPIANTAAYVLDTYSNLVPNGVTGELYIGGDGLARGYLNRPELTAEKFSRGAPPLTPYPLPLTPYYRTGDLVRRRPDGQIEFQGRIDGQVKIRGFRIELKEIENQLLTHPEIKDAVITVREDKQGSQRYLCGYIVSDRELTISQLRDYLSKSLPHYMIPLYFVPLERIPLNSSGKVDRKALPVPDAFQLHSPGEYTAAGTNLEKTIAGIWKDVLKLEKISIDDNFFDIGGNSLNIIQVSNLLNQVVETELPVVEMFRHTTIRSLARYLGQPEKEDALDRKKRSEALERGKNDRQQRYQKRKQKKRNLRN